MLIGLFAGFWPFMLLFSIVMMGCIVEFMRILRRIAPRQFVALSFLSLLYIVLPILLLADMAVQFQVFSSRQQGVSYATLFSPLFPCAVIFSIWINDTMAYIVGSMIGKTPFSKISPKKTWEGTGGGALLCVVVIAALSRLIPAAREISLQHWIAVAALAAVFGTLGDLLESKLKRMAGVKDSGRIMPGHGGFLDRFDSLLIATPFVWLYLKFFVIYA